MLKRLNVSIFTGILLLSFSLTPMVLAVPETPIPQATELQTQSVDTSFDEMEQVRVKDLDIDPIDTASLRKSVVPDPKQEGKKVIGLFLKTMLAVAFCAVILYVVLYFVKKFYGNLFVSKEYNKEVENLDLSTPETKEDAFKSFLNRTK